MVADLIEQAEEVAKPQTKKKYRKEDNLLIRYARRFGKKGFYEEYSRRLVDAVNAGDKDMYEGIWDEIEQIAISRGIDIILKDPEN